MDMPNDGPIRRQKSARNVAKVAEGAASVWGGGPRDGGPPQKMIFDHVSCFVTRVFVTEYNIFSSAYGILHGRHRARKLTPCYL
jgi:hypothetical protein